MQRTGQYPSGRSHPIATIFDRGDFLDRNCFDIAARFDSQKLLYQRFRSRVGNLVSPWRLGWSNAGVTVLFGRFFEKVSMARRPIIWHPLVIDLLTSCAFRCKGIDVIPKLACIYRGNCHLRPVLQAA